MYQLTYKEALDYIHGTLKFGIKAGLGNIGKLLELLSNPHKELEYVHVAGTNGKGSTVAFISGILSASGHKTGVYTSPYLERFTERIRINDREISESDVARLTGLVRENVDIMLNEGWNHPTEFEILTAMAFQYFRDNRCDIVVLEVGLGGRSDSTNIIGTPHAAVITTINYDHTAILGDTLEKIAFEKAGIIKAGGDVILYPQIPGVEDVFEQACLEQGARLNKCEFGSIKWIKNDSKGQVFSYKGQKPFRIRLLGDHQVHNAVMAVETAELLARKGYRISGRNIRKGLAGTVWPGRFEVVKRRPAVVIDVAHNPECCEVLAKSLAEYFPGKRVIFIMGVLKDKDYNKMIQAVAPSASRFFAVTPLSDRALPANKLAEVIRYYCNDVVISDKIKDAVISALKDAKKDDVICAFGSFVHTGEIRRCFVTDRG